MTVVDERARALALIDELCGEPDEAADRVVAVMRAYGAAVGWVHHMVGRPTPSSIGERLISVSNELRSVDDDRDPAAVLIQVAVDAVAEYRAATGQT